MEKRRRRCFVRSDTLHRRFCFPFIVGWDLFAVALIVLDGILAQNFAPKLKKNLEKIDIW